ncbi:MAG: alpha-ketoacid dehydrogenase subunit beta [bacterium]
MSDPETIAAALNKAHYEIMRKDDSVVVMGEDVGENGGVFRITEGLLEEFGEQRVIDTPLAEAGILGSTVGMSSFGLKPIAEVQFSGFIYPGMDQIVSHLSRMRTRTRGEYTCPVVIRAPYTGGIEAPEHHSESMESMYCHVPGLKVVTPASPSDARNMLHGAVMDPDPVLFLEPKSIYRSVKEELPEDPSPVKPGSARVVREGDDLTIISWGAMLRMVDRLLRKIEGPPSTELIDVRSLSPIDHDPIIQSVKKTGKAIIVQEAPRNCGLASEISAVINERALLHLEAPISRVTGFDTVMPLSRMEDDYLPGELRVKRAMESTLTF